MRSKVIVTKGKGKAPAPKRKKIQEGRLQQETSSEDEIEAEPNENIQDEDKEPTQREQTPNEGSDIKTIKTKQQMDENICEIGHLPTLTAASQLPRCHRPIYRNRAVACRWQSGGKPGAGEWQLVSISHGSIDS